MGGGGGGVPHLSESYEIITMHWQYHALYAWYCQCFNVFSAIQHEMHNYKYKHSKRVNASYILASVVRHEFTDSGNLS